jgi:hypothetical protein
MEVRLSEIFYGNMSFGEIKDESLRNKILDQITSKTNRYSHTGEVSFVEIIKDQYSYNKNQFCFYVYYENTPSLHLM